MIFFLISAFARILQHFLAHFFSFLLLRNNFSCKLTDKTGGLTEKTGGLIKKQINLFKLTVY